MKKEIILFALLVVSYHLFSQPTIQWQKCLGGTNSDGASSIIQTNDGGYIIAGIAVSNDGDVVGNHGGGGIAG